MCRAHRVIVVATVIAWAGALALMFVPLVATGNVRAVAMLAAVNVGAIASCLTTVAVLPYLLRGLYEATADGYLAAYLAGVARRQDDAPAEPRLHAARASG